MKDVSEKNQDNSGEGTRTRNPNDVDDASKTTVADSEADRREFMKNVTKGAKLAPVVATLLSATTHSAKATVSGCGCGS